MDSTVDPRDRITDIVGRVQNTAAAVTGRPDKITVQSFLFLLPALTLFLVFMAYPLVRLFLMSFQQFPSLTGQAEWVGTANYGAAIADPIFWTALKNTAAFSVFVALIPIILALFFAVSLDSIRRGSTTLRALIFSPMLVPEVIAGVLFVWLFSTDYGVINVALLQLGIIESNVRWLSSQTLALPTVGMVSIWMRTGLYMVILLAGLQSIPDEVYEAAKVHGKSRWQIFRYITIPMLKPSLMVVLILGLISTVKLFGDVYVMTEGGPARATETLATYFYEVIFLQLNIGKGAALALIILALSLVLSILSEKISGSSM